MLGSQILLLFVDIIIPIILICFSLNLRQARRGQLVYSYFLYC